MLQVAYTPISWGGRTAISVAVCSTYRFLTDCSILLKGDRYIAWCIVQTYMCFNRLSIAAFHSILLSAVQVALAM